MISATLASDWLWFFKTVSHLSHFGTHNFLIPCRFLIIIWNYYNLIELNFLRLIGTTFGSLSEPAAAQYFYINQVHFLLLSEIIQKFTKFDGRFHARVILQTMKG